MWHSIGFGVLEGYHIDSRVSPQTGLAFVRRRLLVSFWELMGLDLDFFQGLKGRLLLRSCCLSLLSK